MKGIPICALNDSIWIINITKIRKSISFRTISFKIATQVYFLCSHKFLWFINTQKNNDILNDCILNVQNWNTMRCGNSNLSSETLKNEFIISERSFLKHFCISHVNQSIIRHECYAQLMFGRLHSQVNITLVPSYHELTCSLECTYLNKEVV